LDKIGIKIENPEKKKENNKEEIPKKFVSNCHKKRPHQLPTSWQYVTPK